MQYGRGPSAPRKCCSKDVYYVCDVFMHQKCAFLWCLSGMNNRQGAKMKEALLRWMVQWRHFLMFMPTDLSVFAGLICRSSSEGASAAVPWGVSCLVCPSTPAPHTDSSLTGFSCLLPSLMHRRGGSCVGRVFENTLMGVCGFWKTNWNRPQCFRWASSG